MSSIVKGIKKGVKTVFKAGSDLVKGAVKVVKKVVTSKVFWAVVAVAAVAYAGYAMYSAGQVGAAAGNAGAINTAAGAQAVSGTGAAAGTAGSTALTPVATNAAQGLAAPSAEAITSGAWTGPGSLAEASAAGASGAGAGTPGAVGAEQLAPVSTNVQQGLAPTVEQIAAQAGEKSLLEQMVMGAKSVGKMAWDNPLASAMTMNMVGSALSPDEMDLQENRQDWLDEQQRRREANLDPRGININVRPARPATTLAQASAFTPQVPQAGA